MLKHNLQRCWAMLCRWRAAGVAAAAVVPRRARRALLGAFLLLLVVMVAAAGWYTSRSEFCNSCHIMEPYYKSWQESAHKDVPCIECHFAAGLRQQGSRQDAGAGPVGQVRHQERGAPAGGRGARRQLPAVGLPRDPPALGPRRLSRASISITRRTWAKLRRGKQLRCTSCHSQIVQGKHMEVTKSTCFLCHFKDEPFNEGLAACTHCHQIPDEGIRSGRRHQVHPRIGVQEGGRLHQLPRRRDSRQGRGAPRALPGLPQPRKRSGADQRPRLHPRQARRRTRRQLPELSPPHRALLR